MQGISGTIDFYTREELIAYETSDI